MNVYEQKKDKTQPPTKWFSPVYGDGLLTTGENPNDDRDHGYCYQPRISVPSGTAGFSTDATYTVYGFNPELQDGDPEKDNDPQFHPYGRCLGWHPYFAKREDAVAWLKDRKVRGSVLRYAHHKPVDQRGPTWDYESFGRCYEWKQYCPWLTAGVTDFVTDEENSVSTTPLGLAAGFTLHQPDGTTKHVGGNEKVLAAFWDAVESIEDVDENGHILD